MARAWGIRRRPILLPASVCLSAIPKLVARGGFGIFYNGFENRGFSPNLGENYPFQFNFPVRLRTTIRQSPIQAARAQPSRRSEVRRWKPDSPALRLILLWSMPAAWHCAEFSLTIRRRTPWAGTSPFSTSSHPTMSIQAGYVTSLARHLEVFPDSNNVTTSWTPPKASKNFVPSRISDMVADYATTNGNSWYHSLQTKVEKQFANGLNFLATYTFSKTETDAGDLLNGGSTQGFRAPDVPGAGIHYDYGLAPSTSGTSSTSAAVTNFPSARASATWPMAGGLSNAVVGGWSLNSSATLQGGQPLRCHVLRHGQRDGLLRLLVKANPEVGLHTDAQWSVELDW